MLDTILAWLTFVLVVWLGLAIQTHGKEIGEGRIPGPIWCARALYETAREAREEEGTDTDGDGKDADTRTDTGQEVARGVDKSQDTTPDTGQDTPRTPILQRARQAVDQVIRREPAAPEPVSAVHVPAPPPSPSPTVTEPVPAPEMVWDHAREVIVYVPTGDPRTGAIRAVDGDNQPIIIRYQRRGTIAAPVEELSRPPADDEDDEDEARALTEITLRRDWLASLDADSRFSEDEVAAMYRTKWSRGTKTLKRDRDALRASNANR